jgi:hypothetical protein
VEVPKASHVINGCMLARRGFIDGIGIKAGANVMGLWSFLNRHQLNQWRLISGQVASGF